MFSIIARLFRRATPVAHHTPAALFGVPVGQSPQLHEPSDHDRRRALQRFGAPVEDAYPAREESRRARDRFSAPVDNSQGHAPSQTPRRRRSAPTDTPNMNMPTDSGGSYTSTVGF